MKLIKTSNVSQVETQCRHEAYTNGKRLVKIECTNPDVQSEMRLEADTVLLVLNVEKATPTVLNRIRGLVEGMPESSSCIGVEETRETKTHRYNHF